MRSNSQPFTPRPDSGLASSLNSRLGRAARAFVNMFIFIGALLVGSCNSGGTVLVFNMAGLREDVVGLQPVLTVDGMPSKDLAPVKDRLDQIALRLPEGTSGRVRVEFEAIGSSTCVVALGVAEFDVNGESQITVPVAVSYFPTPQCVLTVVLAGTGKGSVKSDPAGIDCGAKCTSRFSIGYTVRLTATPEAMSGLANVEGATCKGTVCELSLQRPYRLTFTFNSGTGVTIMKAGDGSGTVVSEPASVNCGTQCNISGAVGSTLTLRANPAADSFFEGWTGSCQGTGPCVVQVGFVDSLTATFRKKVCTPEGICWENPIPYGRDLDKVFGFADDDIWAVGERGTVVRKRNGSVSSLPVPAVTNLHAIWGTAPTNVWVAGDSGIFYRWDGTTWSNVTRPGAGVIYDIFGLDANTIWAVGVGGVLRWNGATWTQESLPAPAIGGSYDLRGVHASGPNNVWAAGYPSATLRFDGTSWAQVGTPNAGRTTDTFRDVFTFANNNAWIVGVTVNGNGAWNWNGTMWVPHRINSSGIAATSLFGVDASNLWAGGPLFTATYNGFSWTTDALGGVNDLRGLWSNKAGQVWVVGAASLFLRSDSQNLYYYLNSDTLWRSWAQGPNDIWAVGTQSIARFNGASWSVMKGPQTGGSNYRGIWGLSSNEVWISDFQQAYRWDGSAWTAYAAPLPGYGFGLWAVDSRNVFMTGEDGNIVRFDGTRWRSYQNKASNQILYGIWGADIANIWAAGCNGTMLYNDGLSWKADTVIPMRDTSCFRAVHGTAKNDVWAVSDNMTWHYDGAAWTQITPGGTGVFARARDDVWVTAGNTVRHFDGTTWATLNTDTNDSLYGVVALASNNVVFVGGSTAVFRYTK